MSYCHLRLLPIFCLEPTSTSAATDFLPQQPLRNGSSIELVQRSNRGKQREAEGSKAIRKKMKEDIRKQDEKQIIEAIENSKSLKQARQKQCLGKGQLISIMEEDGTHIQDNDRIVKR